MMIILLLSLCIATKNYEVYGSVPNLSKSEDSALEEHLKIINKPPIKTIQTEFGRIVDCIDINKQLAFDHPQLKNHKIQLKSSFQDTQIEGMKHDGSTIYSEIGLNEKDSCPKGTIPVQRTTKEDLIRTNKFGTLAQFDRGSHFAGLVIKRRVCFGIVGTLDVYNPPVSHDQMSSAYIWLSTGPINSSLPNYAVIHAGWQVYPRLSGDNLSHFFVSWENRIQHTGCTNHLCPGFVQTSQTIYIGAPVRNVSTYGGAQFSMSLNLTQDPNTKNWWLRAQNMDVGYFPAALFSNRLNFANRAGWTGQTKVFVGETSPQMGSGHFPDGNPRHSSYISKLYYKDRFRDDHIPLKGGVRLYADNPNCYNATYYGYVDDILQHVMMYGGPGGNCGL